MTKVKRSSFTPTLEVNLIFLWVWFVSFCMFSNFYHLDLHNGTYVRVCVFETTCWHADAKAQEAIDQLSKFMSSREEIS